MNQHDLLMRCPVHPHTSPCTLHPPTCISCLTLKRTLSEPDIPSPESQLSPHTCPLSTSWCSCCWLTSMTSIAWYDRRTFLFTPRKAANYHVSLMPSNVTGAPSSQADRHWFLVDAKKLKRDGYTDVLIGNPHVRALTQPPSYSAAASKSTHNFFLAD